ncbi:DsbA family protein [Hyphococcus sp. DH-69]|uniref:DsbA family protein n=1 Tax=Hyphococcus formosus TaxID=3143534 RepID=UPI00398AC43C
MSQTIFSLRQPVFKSGVAIAASLALIACGGANSESSAESTPAEPTETAEIQGEGALSDMALGNPDAKVTVIEFASVTCPHCATFHEDIFPAIKEKYVDTGKVRFIFREFPTAPANLSVAGSMLARCAADKGGPDAYFLILGSLFKTQQTWIYGESPRTELLKIASQAGMDEADFDACVKREELLDFLNENINEAADKYKIASTPSFVVNGQTRHLNSVEAFSEALDEALEKAGGTDGEEAATE